MKEYIKREIKPGNYEYGYKIQKLDIKTMIELNLPIPQLLKKVYDNGFKEEELKDYLYFTDPEVYEYIRRQYFIRDYIEFSDMNLYDLELLLKYYNKRIEGLTKIINKISNKERLNDLEINLKLLKNEMQGVFFLRDNLIESHNKNK